MKPKSHKSALPIYVFIAAWLLCATLLPLYRLGGLLAAVVISVVCAVGAEGLLEYRRAKNAPPEPEMAVSHGPEVDAIVAQGKTAMDEMRRLRSFETPAQKTKRKARANAKRNKNKFRFTLRTAAAPAAAAEEA